MYILLFGVNVFMFLDCIIMNLILSKLIQILFVVLFSRLWLEGFTIPASATS